MSDYIASNIRTVTGVAVGQVLAWLAVRYGIVIDAQSTAAAILAAGAVTSAAWYALVRQLEKRWPIFGWLLGLAKAPSYPGAIDTTGRPASGGVVAGGPFAGWPVGLPVSVGPMPPSTSTTGWGRSCGVSLLRPLTTRTAGVGRHVRSDT